MRDPETLLEVMTMRNESYPDAMPLDPAWSIEAMLILAEQVKRIADLLESITWEPDDQQRALIVIQPHAEGSIGPG